jgi:lipoate synthase
VNEARRMKELERENSELKKMLAESLLKNRVLEAVCEKKPVTPLLRCYTPSVLHGRSATVAFFVIGKIGSSACSPPPIKANLFEIPFTI